MKRYTLSIKFPVVALGVILTAAILSGCSGVESEPIGAPTPEAEYELTEEELNAEQRR